MLFRWGAYETIFVACCPQTGKVFVKKGFLKKIYFIYSFIYSFFIVDKIQF